MGRICRVNEGLDEEILKIPRVRCQNTQVQKSSRTLSLQKYTLLFSRTQNVRD